MSLLVKHANALKAMEGIYTWTTGSELAWLAEQASKHKNVLEIGTHHGASAVVMAYMLKKVGGRLVCVDLFEPMETETMAHKNLAPFAGVVELRKGEAGVVGQKLHEEGYRFDMVWIDDGHSYEDVRRDIATAKLVTKAGALICGHDFVGEVERAVREEWPNVERGPDSIWVAPL